MNEEKKLSKDELVAKLEDCFEDSRIQLQSLRYEIPETEFDGRIRALNKAENQTRQLIESSAQAKEEPSKKWVEGKAKEVFIQAYKRGYLVDDIEDFIRNLLKEAQEPSKEHIGVFPSVGAVKMKEPSEAEVAEFVEECYATIMEETAGDFPTFGEDDLGQMLKEYDKLRRG